MVLARLTLSASFFVFLLVDPQIPHAYQECSSVISVFHVCKYNTTARHVAKCKASSHITPIITKMEPSGNPSGTQQRSSRFNRTKHGVKEAIAKGCVSEKRSETLSDSTPEVLR